MLRYKSNGRCTPDHTARSFHVLCFVDRAPLYNLVNKPTWCIIFSSVYFYLSISTCFGLLWAHHQEIQLSLCDTWYLLCMDDYLVCRVEQNFIPPCIPGSHPYRKTSTKCCVNTDVSPDDGHIAAWNMYRLTKKNILRKKLCAKLTYLQYFHMFSAPWHTECLRLFSVPLVILLTKQLPLQFLCSCLPLMWIR